MTVLWSEVLEHWRTAEEERWRAHYTERGFLTWEAWRMKYLGAVHPELWVWSREDAVDIPRWYIAGFEGGKKYWPAGATVARYAEIAQSPILLENPKVKDLIENLHQTTFIVARCGGECVVIDGFHRAAAYAYRALHRMPLPKCEVYVADFPETERVRFDAFRHDIPSIVNK